jgi:general secretion pathway protein C
MLTDARLLPNIVNGRQEGFAMSEVRSGGLYHTLGLRNGDVLLRVNDFDISSTESGLQAFTALKGMDRIKLDMLRNGQRMSLTCIIR